MRNSRPSLCLAVGCAVLLAPAFAAGEDYVELWQSCYNGTGKPGFFKLKLDGTSGWLDTVKDCGGTRKQETIKLRAQEVQSIFRRLNELGIWEVQPVPLDKEVKGKFVHTGRVTLKEGRRKRVVKYQIDKEYITGEAKLVGMALEPKSPMSKIDRLLTGLGRPMREPVASTPE